MTVSEDELIRRARAAIKPTDSIELVRAFEHLASVEWEYIGADMSGEPDWESWRVWGTVPEEQGKFRRRKAGPWEPVSAD